MTTSAQSIFLPLNLHSEYRNVLDYGISIAQKANAKLDVFFADGSWLKFGKHIYSDTIKTDFFASVSAKDESSIRSVIRLLESKKIKFRFIYVHASPLKAIAEQVKEQHYDLMVMGTRDKENKGIIRGPFVNQVLEKINVPAFIVPETLPFNDIQHITYASDLADYDENIVNQIIDIAKIFDAKLSLVHINTSPEQVNTTEYLNVLEKTVEITLQYPKILYNFLDNTDIFSGIESFVESSNTNLLAMINRKPWNVKKDDSYTQRAIRNLDVPLLAFKK